MCDESAPDNSAATQEQAAIAQQQAQTDANITQGQQNIDSAFSQFTPAYYGGITSAYENAYDPQLADQYNIAQDQLTAQLAGQGMGQSSVGNNAQAQLAKTNEGEQATIADQGQNAAQSLESTVNNTENTLSAENQSAANPSLAASQAQAASGALVAPQTYPSLSNVFASALTPLASGAKAASGAVNYTPYAQTTTPTSGNGSAVFG